MLIAVYSDIHDNQHNIRQVLNMMKEKKVNRAICLGDINSPFIIKELIKFGIPTDCIWGNNEGEKVVITKEIDKSNGLFTISNKTFEEYELDGKKVMAVHYDDIAKSLAKSGDFDAVFYGHNHEKYFEMVGNCILANPGEVSANATGICSFMIWNTKTNEVEFVEIPNPVNVNS